MIQKASMPDYFATARQHEENEEWVDAHYYYAMAVGNEQIDSDQYVAHKLKMNTVLGAEFCPTLGAARKRFKSEMSEILQTKGMLSPEGKEWSRTHANAFSVVTDEHKGYCLNKAPAEEPTAEEPPPEEPPAEETPPEEQS